MLSRRDVRAFVAFPSRAASQAALRVVGRVVVRKALEIASWWIAFAFTVLLFSARRLLMDGICIRRPAANTRRKGHIHPAGGKNG